MIAAPSFLQLRPDVAQKVEFLGRAGMRAGGGKASPQVLTAMGAPFVERLIHDSFERGLLVRRNVSHFAYQYFGLTSHDGNNNDL